VEQEVTVRYLPWQKIILSIFILAMLIGASGCQSNLAKAVENTLDSFSQIPDHVGNIFSDVLGSLSDIGGALADQVSKIIGNMTGR
jgi:phage-related protein